MHPIFIYLHVPALSSFNLTYSRMHWHVHGTTVDPTPRKYIRSPKVKSSLDDDSSVHSVEIVVNSWQDIGISW
jgi:hypothetical protein